MRKKYDKRLPNFSGNNVITVEEYIEYFYSKPGEHNIPRDHEHVVIKLLEISLDKEAKSWYRNLENGSIKTW